MYAPVMSCIHRTRTGKKGNAMSQQMTRLLISALQAVEKQSVTHEAGLGIGKINRPKSRQGKKAVSGHFEPAIAWQLKKLALDRETTVQSLLEEALDDLFAKYHLK